MNKTVNGIACFEKNLNTMIESSKGDHMPYAALIGVLHLAIDDLSKEASSLPVDGDQFYRRVFEGET